MEKMLGKYTFCHVFVGIMVYSVLSKPSQVTGAYYTKRYMIGSDGECQPVIDVSHDDAGKLSLTTSSHYDTPVMRPPWECVTRVTCSACAPGRRLLLKVLTMDINQRDALDIYDGGDINTGQYLYSLSGMYSSYREFTNTGTNMMLAFKSAEKPAATRQNAGFTFIYTLYTDHGPCGSDQYNCTNERCIDTALVCDEYDNCGDYSDEGSALCGPAGTLTNTRNTGAGGEYGGGELVAIALGCMFLVFAAVVCLFYVSRRWLGGAGESAGRSSAYSVPPPAAAAAAAAGGKSCLVSDKVVPPGGGGGAGTTDFDNPLQPQPLPQHQVSVASGREATLRSSASRHGGGAGDDQRY